MRADIFSSRSFVLTCIFIGLSTICQARTITVCMGDRDYPPLFFLDHDGQAQWLVRKALERQGDTVKFEPVPWRRCLDGLRKGLYQAGLPVAANPVFFSDFAFPMLKEQVDQSRALGHVSHTVLRRVGVQANWDGHAFTQLNTPVMYPAGIIILKDKLHALGVAGDDGSSNEVATLRKLLARRAELAIIQAQPAEDLLLQDEFRNHLEVLPAPFISFSVYLAFNKAFHAAAPAYVESVWKEIKHLRASPEWKQRGPALAH